jgi:hypothetical protein
MRILFLCIFGLFLNYHCKAQAEIEWALPPNGPVTIDGMAKEWRQPFEFYDADTKMRFGIMADSVNAYFCFQTSSVLAQLKINQAGLRITLANKGKSKRNASILYPYVHSSMVVDPLTLNAGREPEINQFKEYFLAEDTQSYANGFLYQNGLIYGKDSLGLFSRLNWDSLNNLTLEFRIPLKEILGVNYTASDLQEVWNMKVELEAIEKPETLSSPQSTANMGGPAMGTGSINNPNSMNNPGGMGARNAMSGPMGGMPSGNAASNSNPRKEDKYYQKIGFKGKVVFGIKPITKRK